MPWLNHRANLTCDTDLANCVLLRHPWSRLLTTMISLPHSSSPPHTTCQVKELSLSGNQPKADMKRLHFRTGTDICNKKSCSSDPVAGEVRGGRGVEVVAVRCSTPGCKLQGSLLIKLMPMEIRTFELRYGAT